MEPFIVDLDDFHMGNTRLDLLDRLKADIPDFKATLFTIPGRCTAAWLGLMRESRPWLDLVPHGWMHDSSTECANWTASHMRAYLDNIEGMGFTRGWKAPGWQISQACYAVLLERGYWLADQPYNDARRPAGLKCYRLVAGNRIHGHIGHMGGHNENELEYLFKYILGLKLRQPELDRPFGFVRDHLETWA